MKILYDEKLTMWREGVMTTTKPEKVINLMAKRIQEPTNFSKKKLNFETHKIKISNKEIKKNSKHFPLFFYPQFKSTSDIKTRWKFAAMKKSAIIFEEENFLKIGIKEAENSSSTLPNTDKVSLDLTFLSKSDQNFYLKFDFSDSVDFGVIHNFDDLGLKSWSKEEMRVDYKLKAVPYVFPSIKIQIWDEKGQEELKKIEVSLPLTINWFKRPALLKTAYIEKSVLEAQGVFLQSDFYRLDEGLFKGKNELKYLIREFKEINPSVKYFLIKNFFNKFQIFFKF